MLYIMAVFAGIGFVYSFLVISLFLCGVTFFFLLNNTGFIDECEIVLYMVEFNDMKEFMTVWSKTCEEVELNLYFKLWYGLAG